MSLENLLDRTQEEANETASATKVDQVYSPSMGELLSETDQLYSKVSANNDLMGKIEAITGDLEHINASFAQEGGLTDYSRTVISRTYKALTGVDVLGSRLLALESVDGADDQFKDGVISEVQQNTLNEFLVALKRMFYDNWGDTKSWYGKITSIRETIRRKNADTSERAIKVKGDPKTPEFVFKNNIDVDNDGKVTHQELLAGLQQMQIYTEKRLTTKVDKEFEDFIVGIQRLIEAFKAKTEIDETELLKYKNLYTPPPEVLTSPVEDPTIRASLTDSKTSDLIMSRHFPGGVYVVMSSPGGKSGATPYSFIEDTWIRLYTPPSANDKESVKVRTFYPNQIINVAEAVGNLIDSLAYFDKSWERRDRFMNRVFGSLDKTIGIISEKLTDSTADKKLEEQLRAITRIMIHAIQIDNTFNSTLINHVIKVAAQSNDLCNACLLQYSDE